MTIQDQNRPVRGVMRPRHVCDHCGRPFGMVTHRWWGNKFCKVQRRLPARNHAGPGYGLSLVHGDLT
jgi:hypothetical protein